MGPGDIRIWWPPDDTCEPVMVQLRSKVYLYDHPALAINGLTSVRRDSGFWEAQVLTSGKEVVVYHNHLSQRSYTEIEALCLPESLSTYITREDVDRDV